LFEPKRDEQAQSDRGDVNEKFPPGMRGLMPWVNVEHGRLRLLNGFTDAGGIRHLF
jgi:hypothetical protein